MIIKLLDPADQDSAKRWDEFVFACPEATFFHRAAWQDIMKDVFRHPAYFFYAEEAGEIQGILTRFDVPEITRALTVRLRNG